MWGSLVEPCFETTSCACWTTDKHYGARAPVLCFTAAGREEFEPGMDRAWRGQQLPGGLTSDRYRIGLSVFGLDPSWSKSGR